MKAVYKVKTIKWHERTTSKKTALEMADDYAKRNPKSCVIVTEKIDGIEKNILEVNVNK